MVKNRIVDDDDEYEPDFIDDREQVEQKQSNKLRRSKRLNNASNKSSLSNISKKLEQIQKGLSDE
jgi:hypothetical protein